VKLNERATRPKLSARVGIDSGAVVIGASAGKEADVFGDVPNIAARVQAAADPDTVMITDATHRLVSGLFVVEDRGAQPLKGIERPLERLRAELMLRSIQTTLAFVLYGASSRQREEAVRRVCDLGERIGEGGQSLRGLISLVQLHFTQGESSRGLELARRCLELARTSQDPALLTDAHWGLAILAESCGYFAEAASNYEVARSHFDKVGRGASLGASLGRVGLQATRWLLFN
jgi:hypothetical protein